MSTITEGPIAAGVVYGVNEFRARTGLGEWAFRVAKRNGLKVTRVGNRVFVAGSDWIEFLAKRPGGGE